MLTAGRRQDVDRMSDLQEQEQAWHWNLGCSLNVARKYKAILKTTLTMELIKSSQFFLCSDVETSLSLLIIISFLTSMLTVKSWEHWFVLLPCLLACVSLLWISWWNIYKLVSYVSLIYLPRSSLHFLCAGFDSIRRWRKSAYNHKWFAG